MVMIRLAFILGEVVGVLFVGVVLIALVLEITEAEKASKSRETDGSCFGCQGVKLRSGLWQGLLNMCKGSFRKWNNPVSAVENSKRRVKVGPVLENWTLCSGCRNREVNRRQGKTRRLVDVPQEGASFDPLLDNAILFGADDVAESSLEKGIHANGSSNLAWKEAGARARGRASEGGRETMEAEQAAVVPVVGCGRVESTAP